MLNENILWARPIDPMSGKLIKDPTFLGALLIGIAFFVLISALVFLAF
jgi:hypothetical protein